MTNRAAAAVHRRLDEEQAEALARDGGALVGRPGALMPPRLRRQDMRSMARQDGPRVLLLQLIQRTSARGTPYLSGWLGKASVVAFEGEPDKHGNPTWDLFVSTPEPREGSR